MARERRSLRDRFHEKYTIDPATGCWLWTGGTPKGYGTIRAEDGTKKPAHRVSYELAHGRIRRGYLVLQLCGRLSCVCPDHLVAKRVADAGTDRAKDRCAKGHELREANLWIGPKGQRVCRACRREYDRSRYDRRRPQLRAATQRWRDRKRADRIAPASSPSACDNQAG